MNENLPLVYLSVLVILLAVTAIFVLREVIKSRRLDGTFSRLQKKLQKEKGTAQDYYQLGSIYLDKKLYVQSINVLQKALKAEDEIEPENKALIYNALGFAYFAQEQYDTAIRHYKDAVKLYPEYAIAFNNLGNVYEKKQMIAKALETYEEVLKFEPNNPNAKRRADSLRKRLVESN